ncbi:hypothetical protein LTR02_003029 [Friedmanniomyces endolithicus]|nr:hypothetical protein LTR75_013053 [Friedmanniomyces endolithicus]KAK0799873.1 hypothetical protein LTR59_005933 [Friedmanniomyces endolithicus]KAK0820278.1 hypothetical protein LTR38_000187 [Friedmanniomyces endolithicus]KAK0851008.1 hypothetical protein LTR03_004298 [Friedmanniomyces endolithicus]KAK0871098.1 hypothetical protein LTS02_002027 [Friedmanniomyces endolithicus]
MTLLGGHQKTAEQQKELREARRLLKERIRDDWEYPPLPAHQRTPRGPRPARRRSDEEARVAGFRFHAPGPDGKRTDIGIDAEPVEWRVRRYSSESESATESAKPRSRSSSRHSEYRFDGPDDVGAQIRDKRSARRRRRQKALRDELDWNDGLQHWTRQRDLWAGARSSHRLDQHHQDLWPHEQGMETSLGHAASPESTPRTSTSSTTAEVSSAASTPDVAPTTSPQLPSTETVDDSDRDLLIPVCSPILPDHPIRKRISPSMYPEIYSKIILQARTPSVPINLQNLISALIEGWKADGEWPPRSTPLEPTIGRPKVRSGSGAGGEGSLKSGVKAVARVLRLTGISETSGQRAREEG